MQKHENLVDLVKSFPANIYLQNLASIQQRTSLSKFVFNFHRAAPPQGSRHCRTAGCTSSAFISACFLTAIAHILSTYSGIGTDSSSAPIDSKARLRQGTESSPPVAQMALLAAQSNARLQHWLLAQVKTAVQTY